MIRAVDDAVAARRGLGRLDVFADAFDVAQQQVDRMLERPVHRVALRRPQLFEVAFDPLARFATAFAVRVRQILRDFVPGQHGARDFVKHRQGSGL